MEGKGYPIKNHPFHEVFYYVEFKNIDLINKKFDVIS